MGVRLGWVTDVGAQHPAVGQTLGSSQFETGVVFAVTGTVGQQRVYVVQLGCAIFVHYEIAYVNFVASDGIGSGSSYFVVVCRGVQRRVQVERMYVEMKARAMLQIST